MRLDHSSAERGRGCSVRGEHQAVTGRFQVRILVAELMSSEPQVSLKVRMTSRRLVTSASNTAVSSRSLLTPGSSVSPLLFARAALARAKSAAPGHGCLEVGALAPAEDDQRTQFLLSRGTLSAAGGAPAVPLIACRPASTGASGRSLAPEDTRVLAGPTRGGPCRLVPVARGAVDQLGRCQDARLAVGRG